MITATPRPWFGRTGAPGKFPRKVNVFENMLAHQGMQEQMPLFPYFGPGDIVPTAAFSFSLPDMPRVAFYPNNTTPEVTPTMAGDGAIPASGQLSLQRAPRGVTTSPRKPVGPE